MIGQNISSVHVVVCWQVTFPEGLRPCEISWPALSTTRTLCQCQLLPTRRLPAHSLDDSVSANPPCSVSPAPWCLPTPLIPPEPLVWTICLSHQWEVRNVQSPSSRFWDQALYMFTLHFTVQFTPLLFYFIFVQHNYILHVCFNYLQLLSLWNFLSEQILLSKDKVIRYFD